MSAECRLSVANCLVSDSRVPQEPAQVHIWLQVSFWWCSLGLIQLAAPRPAWGHIGTESDWMSTNDIFLQMGTRDCGTESGLADPTHTAEYCWLKLYCPRTHCSVRAYQKMNVLVLFGDLQVKGHPGQTEMPHVILPQHMWHLTVG